MGKRREIFAETPCRDICLGPSQGPVLSEVVTVLCRVIPTFKKAVVRCLLQIYLLVLNLYAPDTLVGLISDKATRYNGGLLSQSFRALNSIVPRDIKEVLSIRVHKAATTPDFVPLLLHENALLSKRVHAW